MLKRILYLLFYFVIFNLQSQSNIEKNYFAETLNDTFKNVSLLIVRHYEEINVTPLKKGDYQIETIVRIQYHIKDMAALDYFKTLDKDTDAKGFQVKQIKPDGSIKTIYEFEDPDYDPESKFNDDEESPKENKEIPLENIEIGDIVDYRYVYLKKTSIPEYEAVLINNGRFTNRYQTHPNTNTFKSLVNRDKLLNPKNPILNYCIVVNIPKDLKFNSKSLNMTEKFEAKNNDGITYYEFKKSSIVQKEAEDFSYAYLSLPSIKFTVVQNNPELKEAYPHQFSNPEVSFQDIANLGLSFYNNKNYIPSFLYYLDTRNSVDPYKQVSLSSFFKAFNKTFTRSTVNKIEMLNMMHEYLTNEDELNQHQFSSMSNMVILARYCDHIKLSYNLMACMPRFNGTWQDVLTPYDVYWGLYIPNNGDPIYVSDFSKSGNIYQKFGYLSNTDILLINKVTKSYEILKYPNVNYSENTTVNHVNISFNKDSSNKAIITHKAIYKGFNKFLVDDYLASNFYVEGLNVNTPFFGLVDYGDIYNFRDFRDTNEFYPEYRRLSQSFTDLKLNYKRQAFNRYINKDYGFYDFKLDSFNLINDGNYQDNEKDSLGFNYQFSTSSFLQETSVEQQKLLALGKLITSQFQVSPFKLNERHTDVDISHQRNYKWHIKIEIPKGYKCLNLQTFNQKIDNEAGLFESTLIEKDGFLHFEINKIYKSYHLPKEKWLLMVEFLHKASWLFEQELIIEKTAQ